MNLRKIARDYGEIPFTRHLIMDLLEDYKRPNDKISELISQRELIPVRRGLYIPGREPAWSLQDDGHKLRLANRDLLTDKPNRGK